MASTAPNRRTPARTWRASRHSDRLVEEPRFALDEAAEFVANRRDPFNGAILVLPVREVRDQLAIKRVVDVVRAP